jgi:hypothetical protein
MDDGLEGTSFRVTDRLFGDPFPQVLEGVQIIVPEEFQTTETVFPAPVIVAAVAGLTLQL